MIIILIVSGFVLKAQDSTMLVYADSGLVMEPFNIIQNASHLDEFYEQLFQLKNATQGVVNIIHLGDSHIQADFLTKAIRYDFQQNFGNAGRGLIVPYRAAGTNEPLNLHSFSTEKWESKRCVFPAEPLPIGIGGITIRNGKPNTRLEVFMNDLWQDYAFNSVGLFYLKDRASFTLNITDTLHHVLGTAHRTSDSSRNYSLVKLPSLVDRIIIESIKDDSTQNHTTIFGLNLSNGKPGIIYHSIGVNGAKYTHYNAAAFFAEQTRYLDPNLIIISLGTNEALDQPYVDKRFSLHMDELLTKLRRHNPSAKFILVTPSDGFIRKTRKNPGITKIREQIIAYAVENGLAFYDLYQTMGGEDSAAKWQKSSLMRTDGIHFTVKGYEFLGHQFYQAIMKGYTNYVSVRHP